MKVLCIDMGNTRTHSALIEDGRVVKSWEDPTDGFADAFDAAKLKKDGACGVSWCSVVPREAALLQVRLQEMPSSCGVFHLTNETSPIRLDVKTPSAVGQDRIAGAVGAGLLFKPPYIIVDMGTAVTIDLVDASGAYAGGAIAPGLHAFTDYLNERTALLPSINPTLADYDMTIGKDTVEAMYVGCVKGFCRLSDGIISDIEKAYFGGTSSAAKTVFTGGSVSLLPKKWLAGRKVESNLANMGLFESFKKLNA